MTKEEIIDYLKNKELELPNANGAVILLDLGFGAYVESDSVHGVNFSPCFAYCNYKRFPPFFQVVDEKIIREVGKKIYYDYIKNPKTLYSKIKKHQNLTKKIDEIGRSFLNKREKITDKEITEFYKNISRLIKEWWKYGVIGEDKGRVIETEIIPRFAREHNINSYEVSHILNVLSHPDEQSVFSLERKYFLAICCYIIKNKLEDKTIKELSRNKKLKKIVNSYIKNYFWFNTDFYETKEITPEYLLEDSLKEIKNNKKVNIIKSFKNFDLDFKKIRRKKTKLLNSLNLNQKDREDIKFAKADIKWIDDRKLGMMKMMHYLFLIINDIAKKKGLKYHDLAICTDDELHKFFEKGKRLSKDIYKKRNEGVFFVWEKYEKVKMYYGRDAKELFAIANRFTLPEEIKGKVASKGDLEKIRGIVKIINNPKKDRIKDGEILVASMTRPGFVPLMRAARAIITNEGGLACHAAIVSREMNKPCIIGTKIATKVLKDGDEVEVDAEKGIVRVLK